MALWTRSTNSFTRPSLRFSPSVIRCAPGIGSVVVDSLLIVARNVGFCGCYMFCYALLLCIHSSFASILMGKRELVALFSLSFWCLMIVVLLFLAVP